MLPQRWRDALAVYGDRSVASVGLLGFSSGLPLPIVLGTLSVWLKDSGLTKELIGSFAAAQGAYNLKFLWAPLLDTWRLGPLGRWLGPRRTWILLMQVCCAATIGYLGLLRPADDPGWLFGVVALLCTLSATQDIAVDGYRVAAVQPDQQGAANAAYVFGYRLAMLTSGAGALWSAEVLGWQRTFGWLSLVMAACVAATLWAPRAAGSNQAAGPAGEAAPGERVVRWLADTVVGPFRAFSHTPGWVGVLFFVALFKLGDAIAGNMTNVFLLELGFTKIDLAAISKLFAFVALLPGAFVGGVCVRRFGVTRMLWAGAFVQAASNLMFVVQAQAGAHRPLLYATMGIENFTSGFGTTVFVAYMSALCSRRFSAAQYALLSALSTLGRTFISAGAGVAATALGWPLFFASTALLGLPALLFMGSVERSAERPTHVDLET